MTFTGFVGTVCMFPLRAIINASVALRIHPNMLTLIGVLINVGAAVALGAGGEHFVLAGIIMVVGNIFDFIDGKVALITNTVSRFGAFWDSTLDRFSDIALFLGLIYLYADLGRTGYVMVASLAMMFSIMTSYARARAESLIEKCKVGFMERPERIVLFLGLIFFYSKLGRSDYVMTAALALIFSVMTSYTRARAESVVQKCKVGFMERPERIVLFIIGAFTNRMAGVLWVILVLTILAFANRSYYTYLVLNQRPLPSRQGWRGFFSRVFFWTDERATLAYDLCVIAILAFVWLTPPEWIGDPRASDPGLIGLIASRF